MNRCYNPQDKLYCIPKQRVFLRNFQVQNIVASFKAGFSLDLLSLYSTKIDQCVYERELFPGLKFSPFKSKNIVVILFDRGNIIITGAHTVVEIDETYCFVQRLLLKFKK